MLKQSEQPLYGNDRYEGYCIDLLEKIAEYRQFKYTIHEVSDRTYGGKTGSGQWNGLVGELIRGVRLNGLNFHVSIANCKAFSF